MTQKRKISTCDLSNKELSIQVHLSGLSFCVLDRIDNKIEIVAQENFKEPITPDGLENILKETFENNDTFRLLRKLHLIHSNELSAFVPDALFNKEHLSDYLKFNIKILENDLVVYDQIPQAGLVNVYIPYMNIVNYLLDAYGSFEYKHAATLLIEHLISKAVNHDQPVMYIDLNNTHFELVVIKKRKLIYYNSFFYETTEDFIYYVLFAAEQLGMDTNSFYFEFLKDIDKEDMKYQYAYNYIKNIAISKHKFYFESSNELNYDDLNKMHLLIHSL